MRVLLSSLGVVIGCIVALLISTFIYFIPIGFILWLSNILFGTTFVIWKGALFGGVVASLFSLILGRCKHD